MKSSKPTDRDSSSSAEGGSHGIGEATMLVSHKEVRKEDILVGRRKRAFRMHPGSVAFRAFISSRVLEYENAKSRGQRINTVALATKSILDSGARILKPVKGKKEGHLAVMDERSSHEKVGMAIRDRIMVRQRQSTTTDPGDGTLEEESSGMPSFAMILNQVIGGVDEREHRVERAQDQVSSRTAVLPASPNGGLLHVPQTLPKDLSKAPTMPLLAGTFPFPENNVFDMSVAPNQRPGAAPSHGSRCRDIPAFDLVDSFQPHDLSTVTASILLDSQVDQHQRSTLLYLDEVNQNLNRHEATITTATQHHRLADQVRETTALLFRQNVSLIRSRLRRAAISRSQEIEDEMHRHQKERLLLHHLVQRDLEKISSPTHSLLQTSRAANDSIARSYATVGLPFPLDM